MWPSDLGSSAVKVAGIVDFLLIRSTARPTSTRCTGRESRIENNNHRTRGSPPNSQVRDPPMSSWPYAFHTASDLKPNAASVGRLDPSVEYRVARRSAAQPPMDQTPIRNI